MKVFLYTVYDKVAKEAGPIFEARNDGTARRAFKNLMQKPDFQADINEYGLIALGEYDKDKPEIKALPRTRVVTIDYGDSTEEENE